MKSSKSAKPAKTSGGGDIGTLSIGLAILCMVAIAALVAARRSAQTAETPVMAAQLVQTTPAAASVDAKRQAPAAKPAKSTSAKPAVAAPAAPAEAPAAAPVSATMADSETGVTTVTGCLERDDDNFRLKDTDVVMEPKGRSWKSGFLKKGSTSIEVFDEANGLNLTEHVGERVSVTGRLEYREMHGRSIRRVGASCKER